MWENTMRMCVYISAMTYNFLHRRWRHNRISLPINLVYLPLFFIYFLLTSFRFLCYGFVYKCIIFGEKMHETHDAVAKMNHNVIYDSNVRVYLSIDKYICIFCFGVFNDDDATLPRLSKRCRVLYNGIIDV